TGKSRVGKADNYWDELQSMGDSNDSTRNDRLYMWRRSTEMFLDNLIVGVGAGNFPVRVSEYELKSEEFDPAVQHLHGGRVAHSLYFTLIPEYGLVGIFLYGGATLLVVVRLRRIARHAPDNAPPVKG